MAQCAAVLEIEQEPMGAAAEWLLIVVVNVPTVFRYCDRI
jgi:hypothetical protein